MRTAEYFAPAHEDVSFRTSDGLTLSGWWFPAPSRRQRAVVIVHGKDQTRIDSCWKACRLGARVVDAPVTRAYPALGPTPTKIGSLRAYWHMIGPLLAILLGRYR